MAQPLTEETARTLDVIARILIRCFLITVIALVFVWALTLAFGDFFYRVQALFVGISREDYDLFLLDSLTFIKSLNVVFFLFPYVAIRQLLRGHSK